MQAKIQLSRDDISSELLAAARKASDKRGIHEAMGVAVVSLAKRAFRETRLRPSPWPKRQGSPAHLPLQKSTALRKSIRVTSATAESVTVGSDRKYAAIHQLGGKTAPFTIRPKKGKALYWPGAKHPVAKVEHPGSVIPARPYLPFTKQGRLTPLGAKRVAAAIRGKLGLGRSS